MSHPIKHFNTVIQHKWYVFHYGCKLHIFWTALVHDTSKFSPTEFIRSARYYQGDKSPTIEERKQNHGVSYICLHHALRNKHHWHAYVDFTWKGVVIAPINYRHSVEYVCDVMSASRTYNKKFDMDNVIDFFNKDIAHSLLHPGNREFIKWSFQKIKADGFKSMKKKLMKSKYAEIMAKYEYSYKIDYDENPLNFLNKIEQEKKGE